MRTWLLLLLAFVGVDAALQKPALANAPHDADSYYAMLKFTADGVAKPTATLREKFSTESELNFEEKHSASGWTILLTVDPPTTAADGRNSFPAMARAYELIDGAQVLRGALRFSAVEGDRVEAAFRFIDAPERSGVVEITINPTTEQTNTLDMMDLALALADDARCSRKGVFGSAMAGHDEDIVRTCCVGKCEGEVWSYCGSGQICICGSCCSTP